MPHKIEVRIKLQVPLFNPFKNFIARLVSLFYKVDKTNQQKE